MTTVSSSYAKMKVSSSTYEEIKSILMNKGYSDQVHQDGVIDLYGLALVLDKDILTPEQIKDSVHLFVSLPFRLQMEIAEKLDGWEGEETNPDDCRLCVAKHTNNHKDLMRFITDWVVTNDKMLEFRKLVTEGVGKFTSNA